MSRALATLLALVVLATAAAPGAASEPKRGVEEAAVSSGPAGAAGPPEMIPGQVVVAWAGGVESARGRARALQTLSELGAPGMAVGAVLSTGGRPVEDVIAELEADPSIAYAEPNYRVTLAVDPTPQAVSVNDPSTSDQYSLDRMRVRDAWAVGTGGRNVIAVLDTGVQFTHPDLQGRLATGWDFVNDDRNATDDNGHGTWVSGIIAANANDGYGIAGISWSDYILPIKIMDRQGTGNTADLASGIRYAADRGASVINMSVGGFPYSQAVQDAVDYAWGKGAVLIGAAGNNGREESFYPASMTNVVSVSATQPQDELSHWSSFGPKVDVSAPGSSVLTTNCYTCTYADHDTWGSHVYISGTSFATPNVAGVVALIRARFPTDGPQQIVDRLLASVDDAGYPGWDNRYGLGRVNAFRALTAGSATASLTTGGDTMEPNNSIAAPRRINIGTTVRPSIHPAGDVDAFAVDAPRMGRLDIRVTGVVDSRAYPWQGSSLPIDPILEVYSEAGTLLARADNVWESGTETASLSVSGPTRLVIRVSNYYANGNPATYSLSTAFVDEVPPKVLSVKPAPGSAMVSPLTSVTFRFSEPVTGVDGSSVTLRTSTGAAIPSSLSYDPGSGNVRLTPSAPLPSDSAIRLSIASSIVDAAGLPVKATSYAFTTMPGEAWSPARRITFKAGLHTGHVIGSGGRILGLRQASLATASGASVIQRGSLPNLPGAWLYVSNGMWAGTWMRESASRYVAGMTEFTALPSTTRLTLTAGTHVGRTFDAAGTVTSTRTARLARLSGANVDAVAVINGARSYRVVNGTWAGYWLTESGAAHRAGFVDERSFSPERRVQIRAGTHTGIAWTSSGTVAGTRTGALSRPSGAPAAAWAVVNGRPHVLIAAGMWAGYWLPEEVVLAYER